MKIKVTVKVLILNFAEKNQRSLTSETELVIPLDKYRDYKPHCQTQPLQIWGANCASKYSHLQTRTGHLYFTQQSTLLQKKSQMIGQNLSFPMKELEYKFSS